MEIRIVDIVEILPVVWPLFAPSDTALPANPRLVCISLLPPTPTRAPLSATAEQPERNPS